MAKEIFISYRRDDSAGTTGRIYDRFVSSFPHDNVFMDVDAAMHGLDFARVLDDKIASSDLVAIVIGPNWLTAVDAQGERRIDAPNDFVRVEVSAALKREVPVIPVLVDGATMPSEQDLPPDLKSLTRRHAVELRNTRFADDADTLVKVVAHRLGAKRRRLWSYAATAAAILVLAGSVLVGHQMGVLPPALEFSNIFTKADLSPSGLNKPTAANLPIEAGTQQRDENAKEKERQLKELQERIARMEEARKAKDAAEQAQKRREEQQAERDEYRERVRQLEFEAEMRKLRREREQEQQRLEEERRREEQRNRSEEQISAPTELDSLPLCEQLWRQRNAIFHKFGYCFSTPKGQQIFGNDGCSRNMDSTWRAMGDDNRRFIKRVQEQERLNAC